MTNNLYRMEEQYLPISLATIPVLPFFPDICPPTAENMHHYAARIYSLNCSRGEYMAYKADCHRLRREMETFMMLKLGELSFEDYFECHLQLKRIECTVADLEIHLQQINLELETLDRLSQIELNFFV